MRDLRLPVLGAAAWSGGLIGAWAARDAAAAWLVVLVLVLVGGWLLLQARWRARLGLVLPAALVLVVSVAGVAQLRHTAARHNPVAALAGTRAAAELEGTVTTDPRAVRGAFGDRVVVGLTVRRVAARGSAYRVRTPVLVLGDTAWASVPLGAHLRVDVRLAPSDDPEESALVVPRGPPEMIERPHPAWRAAGRLRAAIRDAVSHRPLEARSLVPALVDGDDAAVPEGLAEDFRTTGLTHLLAVSGTNLTLVVGFVLALARWCRVRGRWLAVVGAAGITGFVMLARTEPSVVRAAAMGVVGLLAMSAGGRQRALRGLGAAVLFLLLLDPAMATSTGFALSVLATAGILLLAPPWRDALRRWLPGWLAEAVAVPLAAQLACTPLVAAISGQVSLVAVGANLLAEPLVGPATVLGLLGGLVALVSAPAGRLVGTLASWCVQWIITVAHRGAALPAAQTDWGTSAVALGLLTVLCALLAVHGPRLAAHRVVGPVCCVALALVVAVRPPVAGWPPPGWVLVACDVGQGDALAVRAGPQAAIVVDAGPEPAAVERCLDDLGITAVPLVVLTHFHADHVAGLSGVLRGREVGQILTTRLADPPGGVAEVEQTARAAHVPVAAATFGSTRRIGEATFQVLWPRPDGPTEGPGDGSTANDASVVVLVEVDGVRLLLTGDVEPPGQEAMARALPGLHVDLLKVPHHGSRYQDLTWLRSLGAAVAIASVGADNDYGHPARSTLEPLQHDGTRVLRTDRDGTVAVLREEGRLAVRTRS